MKNKWAWGMLAAINIAIFILYAHHVIYGEFVYEDEFSIIHSDWITPFNAHLFSLGLHSINVWLLALLISSWGFEFGPFVGILLLIHPLTVEPVAYANGMHELMAGFFVLIFLHVSTGWWFRLYVLRFIVMEISGYLAVRERPASFAILLVLVLILMVFAKLPKLVISVVTVIMIIISSYGGQILLSNHEWVPSYNFQSLTTKQVSVINYQFTIEWFKWLSVQLVACTGILWRVIVPIRLAIVHPWYLVSNNLLWLNLGLVVLSLGLVVKYFSNRFVLISVIGYWLLWIPRLSIRIPGGWIHEHHAYQPLMILFIGFGYILWQKKYLIAPVIVILLVLTGINIPTWQNNKTLWSKAVISEPHDPIALNNAYVHNNDLSYLDRLIHEPIPSWMAVYERYPYIIGYENYSFYYRKNLELEYFEISKTDKNYTKRRDYINKINNIRKLDLTLDLMLLDAQAAQTRLLLNAK